MISGKVLDGHVAIVKSIARLLCILFPKQPVTLSTLRGSFGKSNARVSSGAPLAPGFCLRLLAQEFPCEMSSHFCFFRMGLLVPPELCMRFLAGAVCFRET